jgi:hypothetical protein
MHHVIHFPPHKPLTETIVQCYTENYNLQVTCTRDYYSF